ncbi:hypothetical protein [Streptomyces sp. NPDC046859]|uniref:hypothetical protein n=1 Tax=Streptomyces sp. NPDC046859 TaxID=3155734 RepID=UPI0033F1DB4B
MRPRLTQYFDPAVDLAAAGVHSVMGAGMAVLFGATGQISGPYAAIVVGASAPVLLTQLARIQSVSEALGGGQAGAGPADLPAAGGAGPGEPVAAMGTVEAAGTVEVAGTACVDPAQRPVPSVVQPELPEQVATASTTPALQPDAEAGPARGTSSHLRHAAFQQDTDTPRPQPNGHPTGPGHAHDGRDSSPLRNERAVGEEGRP